MNTEYEHYFDGIPPELSERHEKMTMEELEAEIENEKKKSEELPEW